MNMIKKLHCWCIILKVAWLEKWTKLPHLKFISHQNDACAGFYTASTQTIELCTNHPAPTYDYRACLYHECKHHTQNLEGRFTNYAASDEHVKIMEMMKECWCKGKCIDEKRYAEVWKMRVREFPLELEAYLFQVQHIPIKNRIGEYTTQRLTEMGYSF